MTSMTTPIPPLASNHTSVDCVVFAFDGEKLHCLLLRRTINEGGRQIHDMKLPGSIIFRDEDLDDAARRVLGELTGLKNIHMEQFRAYGGRDRTADPRDVKWLEEATGSRIDRIVTVAYMALIRLDRALAQGLNEAEAVWVPVEEVPQLAFDHNMIVRDALAQAQTSCTLNPAAAFDLLPRRFTAAQLRRLYVLLSGRDVDARNFYKKLHQMPYVVPLDETEKNVPHRAARLFRFDRTAYNKTRR